MDYSSLVDEFMQKMQSLQRAKPFKQMGEGMQGEGFILFFISEREKECDVIPGDISSVMGVSSARVAAALNSLENKSFITREIDTNDRRRIIVKTTKEGREYSERQMQRHKKFLEMLLRGLGDHDAKEYLRITEKLVNVASDLCVCEEEI